MLIRLILLKGSVHILPETTSLLTLLSYFIGLFSNVAAKPVKMQSQDFMQTLDYYLPPISFG